jgi:uroporphyrin-III C-methyltransferase/precorrin-2 dehydrogenase/sirohydrochlorin ferrochelatase
MRWFPLFLDLRGRRVVVIGGGTVAERKVDLLLAAGPTVLVIAPALTPRLAARVASGEVAHETRMFTPADVDGARLVVAATDAPLVNRAVATAAEARGIPVNVVDDAELSSAIMPAIIDRSPLVIAVSTEGTAPALARFVRARIESVIDESFGLVAEFLAKWRDGIRAHLRALDARRRLYEQVLDGPVAALVRHGRPEAADAAMDDLLCASGGSPRGRVQLVGAGPGDPGLLTLNALRALQGADVVLHDRLVSAEVLALARREAELIEVGKSAGSHSVSQQRIHALMLEHVACGRRVVRLKGGDPFVFGRGGEELEFLRAHGVDYEVVPGITAAVACAAYAGIPLTHRGHSGSVRFVTAHCDTATRAVDWRGLADQRETLAVYMGVSAVGRMQRELLRHGRPASTPVAFVENGSRRHQRVVLGTLGEASDIAVRERIRSPALLIVGAVAALGAELHWFGAPPIVAGARASRRDRGATEGLAQPA